MPIDTHRHVASRSDKRVGHRIDQLSGHSEIANFDFSVTIDQYVGRLNVAVHDSVFVTQITESFQHGQGDRSWNYRNATR